MVQLRRFGIDLATFYANADEIPGYTRAMARFTLLRLFLVVTAIAIALGGFVLTPSALSDDNEWQFWVSGAIFVIAYRLLVPYRQSLFLPFVELVAALLGWFFSFMYLWGAALSHTGQNPHTDVAAVFFGGSLFLGAMAMVAFVWIARRRLRNSRQ